MDRPTFAHRPTEFSRKVRVWACTTRMERGVVLLMERGVCGRVTRRQDGAVLLTDPRNFREKSVCVGVHNTELMERGHNSELSTL